MQVSPYRSVAWDDHKAKTDEKSTDWVPAANDPRRWRADGSGPTVSSGLGKRGQEGGS